MKFHRKILGQLCLAFWFFRINRIFTPYGCFLKWWYPQIIHFNRVFHYKPSIFGVPLFLETSIFFLAKKVGGNHSGGLPFHHRKISIFCCQPSGLSPPPLLSCSYSSSQLEPRRDCSISANRAASRRFSVDRSTHLLCKKKMSYNFKRSDSKKSNTYNEQKL